MIELFIINLMTVGDRAAAMPLAAVSARPPPKYA
jgi:hypothetical protein